ncbi:MAG: hypothetical protein U1G07_24645 [Verrucomicrobiota bacterium]
MSNPVVPKMPKWPFVLGDLLLIGLAVLLILRNTGPMSLWASLACVIAAAVGAALCALPFIREYDAAVKLTEADALATTVAQIAHLEQVKNQIANATGQWHSIQERSTQTVAAAKELTDRMKAEMTEFCAFLQKSQDTEKNHLRLEVEKLRRGERDWLQAAVLMLDHVFALHSAGARSGQPALAGQLNQFQLACRDAVRRLGLVGFAPALRDRFDPQLHQPEGASPDGDAGWAIAEVRAMGFSFRGELVRKALVRIEAVEGEEAVADDRTGAETIAPKG